MTAPEADEGLAVVVTGATSGIGEAVAARFRAGGARLLLTGRRERAPAGMGPDEHYLAGDLGDEAFAAELIATAARILGPIDTLVLCHGLQGDGAIEAMDLQRASALLDANVLSVFSVLQHAVPAMREGASQVVLVSSRLGMVGIAGQVMYTAAKGGLIMLGKGAAIELAPRGIRVNVAAPGLTSTAAIEAGFDRQPDPDAARRARAATIPMGRLARPEEVAEAIHFLGTPASSYVTGAVLPIDGGYTAA
ncbi:SDR family NAD(P)-dependent oxidoreductase [Agrococcus sp. SGAir0287]|uniref:SDR family NAD(P)-dependent oxidoreductase n=1 Tax=Agrococcus sp. SGAir0287 TaxID=2070347 RepID=UPI0010CCC67B|nr:SDR family NAD(P)-dependent oxidoreductase [Agrococcus sp. SGAir0287]QCR20575.1 NAD(P)-dependent oxidoreductase [Agrococcus sp. SGAir0287]